MYTIPGIPKRDVAPVNRHRHVPIKWIRRGGDDSIDLASTFFNHYGVQPNAQQLTYFQEVEGAWPIRSRQVGAMVLATAFITLK